MSLPAFISRDYRQMKWNVSVVSLLFGLLITGYPASQAMASSNAGHMPRHVPEESSNEPGPAWDPRPAWQRAGDGGWFELFRRRPVEQMTPPVIVPVVDKIPFRIPRAMNAVPVEFAEPAESTTENTPGTIAAEPCKLDSLSTAPRGSAAEEKPVIAKLNQILDVMRRDPAFPPPGHRVRVQCGFQKRTDGSGLYRGQLVMFFYPTSNALHLWHGAIKIAVNDLGLMGPRANDMDRMTDSRQVFAIPEPATYLGHPYLGPASSGVWGGIYLSRRPQDIFRPVTYREWLDEHLPQLEAEYRNRQAQMRPKATVTEQVVLRNVRASYERAAITKQQMPANELDAPLWLSSDGPSDAANYNAFRMVRLNTPGYFDRTKSSASVQLINIIPVDDDYNPVRAVLQQLDFEALQQILN